MCCSVIRVSLGAGGDGGAALPRLPDPLPRRRQLHSGQVGKSLHTVAIMLILILNVIISRKIDCVFDSTSHNTDWDQILARRNRCVAVTPGAPPPPPPPPRRPSTTTAASTPSTAAVSCPRAATAAAAAAAAIENDSSPSEAQGHPKPEQQPKRPGLSFDSRALSAAIGGLKPVAADDPQPQDNAATHGAKTVRILITRRCLLLADPASQHHAGLWKFC
jgi:hypothetical protein